MPELSREAMQLLELTPAWHRRQEYLDVHGGPPVMFVVVAANASAEKLWHSMSARMLAMGFDRTLVAEALIMASVQIDRCLNVLQSAKPRVLLCMSEALAAELSSVAPQALEGVRLVALPDLEALRTVGAHKARCWAALCSLKQSVGMLVDADQRI